MTDKLTEKITVRIDRNSLKIVKFFRIQLKCSINYVFKHTDNDDDVRYFVLHTGNGTLEEDKEAKSKLEAFCLKNTLDVNQYYKQKPEDIEETIKDFSKNGYELTYRIYEDLLQQNLQTIIDIDKTPV